MRGLKLRAPLDVGALVAGLVITGLGVVLLLHFLDVFTLDFGTTWPIMLGAAGAILVALGLSGSR